MKQKTIPSQDLDFVRNARMVIKGDRVDGANVLLWTIALVFVALILWADRAEIDEVTKGNGKVIPSSSIQTIQNLEGGIISELLIQEGDYVKKGDVLVRIDDTLSRASYRENLAQKQALEAQLARHLATAKGREAITFSNSLKRDRPDLVERESFLFRQRNEEIQGQLQNIKEDIRLIQKELDLKRPLVAKKLITEVEEIQLERQLNEKSGQFRELSDSFRRDAMEGYNLAKAEIERLEELLSGRKDTVNRTVVRSPVNGTVNHLYVTTLGGVIQPGQPIIDIVPGDDTLLVEAQIAPAKIAFLRPGQEAVVKFTAYDFAIYGGLKGTVEHISADTIEDEITHEHFYQIKVRIKDGTLKDKGSDEELPIIPGMVTEVDVLTGRRTVLQYLLKPIHRMRFNSLRER